MGIELLAFYLV